MLPCPIPHSVLLELGSGAQCWPTENFTRASVQHTSGLNHEHFNCPLRICPFATPHGGGGSAFFHVFAFFPAFFGVMLRKQYSMTLHLK